MKTSLKFFVFLALLVGSLSCDREEVIVEKNGQVSFVVGHTTTDGGRRSAENVPAWLLLSLTDNQGNVVSENKKLELLQFGEGFVTEGVALAKGPHAITKFLVLNSENKVLYATPLEGSDKAKQVGDPLPLQFTVSENASVEVKPQVLTVTAYDLPQSFGYASFGYEVVDGPATMKVKVRVELRVGSIDYLDVDTKLVVTGFDSLKTEKWKKEFSYMGPSDNVLEIRADLDHYTIELQQWGIYDKQIFKRKYLWDSREGGPTPVTYILGGTTAAKKIIYYISYFHAGSAENPGALVPQYKVGYTYDVSGSVRKLTHYKYDKQYDSFEPERQAVFVYMGGRVQKILHYHVNEPVPYMIYGYDYQDDGNVSRIVEMKNGAETAAVDFTYNFTDRLVKAAYTFSNGQGFQYEFFARWKNIQTDKTTRGAQLCSEGNYTHDKNINPLKHLGYVDFLLRDYSINNKLTENITYSGCAFPSLVPYAYAYEYDEQGYPKVATTLYVSKHQTRSEIRYFYQ